MTGRIAAAVFWCGLAVASWLHYWSDRRGREPSDRFVSTYRVVDRRPAHAETIHFAPAADLASEVAADVALQDTTASIDLTTFDPATRQLWIDSVGRYDDELADARQLVLDAVRARPGWPFHRALLGEIEFVRARRSLQLGRSPDTWLVPLESAIASSPGEESFVTFAGSALIEAWPYLRVDLRPRARRLFAAALRNPGFAANSYLDVVDVLGHNSASALLPDLPATLMAAIRAEGEVADVEEVARLFSRWERAEWRERERDLQLVERRAELNDDLGVSRACTDWITRHAPGDFDSPAGRRQVASLLALWPDRPGQWRTDPRAEIILFFLDGRRTEVDGRELARATASLADTPAPIAARAALLGGDLYAAESLVRAADTAGSFEWTRFYVDLAYYHLRAKRTKEARSALDLVSPAAQDECDVALARAAVERGPSPQVPALYPAEYWSGPRVPVCITRGAALEVVFDVSPYPSMISYGFDEGRSATVFAAAGRGKITVPVEGRSGRHIFFLRPIAGGEVKPAAALLR